MTLVGCLFVCRKGKRTEKWVHHPLCTGTLQHSFWACFLQCKSVSLQVCRMRNTFSVHFSTWSYRDSLCLLLVYICLFASLAYRRHLRPFCFKAVAVYSLPLVLMLWIPECKCSCHSIACIEVQTEVQDHILELNVTQFNFKHIKDCLHFKWYAHKSQSH